MFAKTFYGITHSTFCSLNNSVLLYWLLYFFGISIVNDKITKKQKDYLSWAKIQGGAMSEMLGSSWISPWLVCDSWENFQSLIFCHSFQILHLTSPFLCTIIGSGSLQTFSLWRSRIFFLKEKKINDKS